MVDPAKQAHGVERLPEQFSTKTDKTKAIKLQIKYVKMFFDTEDKHLLVSNWFPCWRRHLAVSRKRKKR